MYLLSHQIVIERLLSASFVELMQGRKMEVERYENNNDSFIPTSWKNPRFCGFTKDHE